MTVVTTAPTDGGLICGGEGDDDDLFEALFLVAASVETKITSAGGSLDFGSGGGSDCFCILRLAFGGGIGGDADDYFSGW